MPFIFVPRTSAQAISGTVSILTPTLQRRLLNLMAKFNVVVDHKTEREEAIGRLKTFSDRIRDESPVEVSEVEENWDESGNLLFSFKAMGFTISGSLVTCEQKVTVAGNLPFAALPFRGAIESQIAEKVKEAVAGQV